MLQRGGNLGPKTAEKPASLTRFLLPAEPASLSLSRSPPGRSPANIVTTGLKTSISITSNRPNISYSERAAEPLSSTTFLLPSPATDTDRHSFHRSLLSHRQSLLVAAKLPPQVSLLPSVVSTVHVTCEQWRVIHCSFKKKLNSKNIF